MLMKYAAAVLTLSVASPAWGQVVTCPTGPAEEAVGEASPNHTTYISVEQAVALALQNDLRRDVAGALVETARTEGQIASLRPNDILSIESEDFPRSNQIDDLDSLQITARYSRTWERGHKREAREALAARGVDVALAGIAISDNQIAYDVRRLYASALIASARQMTQCIEIQYITEIQNVTVKRVERSVEPQLAASRISTELIRAQTDLERYRQEEVTLTNLLRDMTGQSVTLDKAVLNEKPDVRVVDLSFDRLPDLLALEAQQKQARARILVEDAKRKADVTWGVGVRTFGTIDEVGVVTGFSIPLGTNARSKATSAKARADERAIEIEKRALRQQLTREASALRQASIQAVSALNALDTMLIPEASKALQLAEEGYTRGALPFRDILDAHEILIGLHKQRIDHLETFLINDAALQRLSGDVAQMETQP